MNAQVRTLTQQPRLADTEIGRLAYSVANTASLTTGVRFCRTSCTLSGDLRKRRHR